MNITFLIGNGFDLNLGLKTSFRDFFDVYCENADGDSSVIEKFKKNISENISQWSDFESQMGVFTKNIIPYGDMTAAEYFDCMADFRDEMVKHITGQERIAKEYLLTLRYEDSFYKSLFASNYIRSDEKNVVNDLLKKFSSEVRNYNFLIFNYTCVFELCLKHSSDGIHHLTPEAKRINDKISKLIHVHGELGDEILIGVNDSAQVVNHLVAEQDEFKYNYIKPMVNDALNSVKFKNTLGIIEKSDIIYVYGMSIGKTDNIWWKTIIKWLLNTTDRERYLVIFYHDSTLSRNSPYAHIKSRNEVEHKLTSSSDNLSNSQKKYLHDHIFVSLNSDMFKCDYNISDYKRDTAASKEKKAATV